MEDSESFYTNGKLYWENIPATVDGMLGGFASISSTDIAGSMAFLESVAKNPDVVNLEYKRALDCGAGIGRITKNFLCKKFDTVDMVESSQNFLDAARDYIGEDQAKVDRLICSGLEEFVPEKKKYNVIWVQWVLGHINDKDLISFFKRCREGLTDNGVLCVKENVAPRNNIFDDKDSSVIRNEKSFENCMILAGLQIVKRQRQTKFPKNLYDVFMYALI